MELKREGVEQKLTIMIDAANQSGPTTTRLKVHSPYGLHMRAAAMVARIAERFHSQLIIEYNHARVDARSLLSLISLGIAGGATIDASASGPDAAEAIAAVETLFANRFQTESSSSRTGNGTRVRRSRAVAG